MAKEEHLKILANGVDFWNNWRAREPEVVPDLSEEGFRCRILCVEKETEGAKEFNIKAMNLQGINLKYANLHGTYLTKINLQGADFTGADLTGVMLSFSNLQNADFTNANLQESIITEANLQKACFYGANLAKGNLTNVNLQGANLQKSNLTKSCLLNANLTEANLYGAILRETFLRQANLTKATLKEATLQGADLQYANIEGANLESANFSGANVANIIYNRKSCYRGINVDSCYGSQMFKSDAIDQDHLEEYRGKSLWHAWIYIFWKISSNCGRSMLIWATWSWLILAFFIFIYYKLGPSHFKYPDGIWDITIPIYFSFVTFSTLGFGDIYPLTAIARLCIVVEVMTGYVMLGGLISILANKLSKRA